MIKKTSSRTTPKAAMPIVEQPKKPAAKTFAFIAIILVVILTAFALMAVNAIKGKGKMQKQDAAQQSQQTQNQTGNDVDKIVSRVSQLIITKTDEQPTVATVQDADLLRQGNPLFYKDAENGDRLLVWSDKAVLYSTKQDRLLAVMPIAMSQAATTTSAAVNASTTQDVSAASSSTIESEKAVIEVRNGTMTAGLGKKLSTLLKGENLDVQFVTDAKKKDYAETVVYKVANKPLDATMQAIVKATQAKVVESLPAETGVKGDVLVVVGENYR